MLIARPNLAYGEQKKYETSVLILTIIGAAITEASPPPAPQFRVSVNKGMITLRDVKNGKVLGTTTFERLGVLAPTQDDCATWPSMSLPR